MNRTVPVATLEPVRFGEFLRDRRLIDDEQWLAALADHWSGPRHRRIGAAIIERGFLSAEVVEAEARLFHDDIEVVEVDVFESSPEVYDRTGSSEQITAPRLRVSAG